MAFSPSTTDNVACGLGGIRYWRHSSRKCAEVLVPQRVERRGAIPAAAEDLMRDCASTFQGAKLYYYAPTGADLEDVFVEIGNALNELHISK